MVPGLTITEEEADERFLRRMNKEFVPGVRERLRAQVTQKQFDAMVSLAYNIGLGNFAGSTLLRLVNSGDMSGAALQFKRWDKAQGLTMKGLQRRRYAEAFTFDGGAAETGIRKAMAVFP